jgi:hypothetical protein
MKRRLTPFEVMDLRILVLSSEYYFEESIARAKSRKNSLPETSIGIDSSSRDRA